MKHASLLDANLTNRGTIIVFEYARRKLKVLPFVSIKQNKNTGIVGWNSQNC